LTAASIDNEVKQATITITVMRDCSIALIGATAATLHSDQTIPYVSSSSWLTVASSSSVFFTNPFSASCGAITSCSLFDVDCSTGFTGTHLKITPLTG
jgi:hypothetical protein